MVLTALNVFAAREIIEKEGIHNGHTPHPYVHAPSFIIGIVVVEQTPVDKQVTMLALNRRIYKQTYIPCKGHRNGHWDKCTVYIVQ